MAYGVREEMAEDKVGVIRSQMITSLVKARTSWRRERGHLFKNLRRGEKDKICLQKRHSGHNMFWLERW